MGVKAVACILRNAGSGWHIISDGDHKPEGTSSVGQYSDRIRLNYDFTAKEVHTFIANVDETYLLQDLMVGVSIGMSYADIYFKRAGQSGYVNPSTLTEAYGNVNVWGWFS